MRTLFVAGNWKMNTDTGSAKDLADAVARGVGSDTTVETLIAPPFPYLMTVKGPMEGSALKLGAQNLYPATGGAYTGEVSSTMLKDVGCEYVILGHSERRHVLGESDAFINEKVKFALSEGLKVILCVGELLEEREGNKTNDVLDTQMSEGLKDVSEDHLSNVVIAYEPVWAIGTGVVATPEQADEAHAHLRGWLTSNYSDAAAQAMRIQYGGSVKPENAESLLSLENIDGALVGGASLKPDAFMGIIEIAQKISSGS